MNGAADTPVHVALLVDDEYVEQWRRNALATLTAESNVEITHVVVNERTRESDQRFDRLASIRGMIRRFRGYPLWSLVGISRVITADPWYHQPAPLDSVDGIATAERLSCTPQSVDEHWNRLPDETVDRIADVDVVVRFGFGMIQGRILHEPTYGVLSYHPGDIRCYRGQPGGLWEFLNDEDAMGVTVQQLTDTLDSGNIAAFETFDISQANTWQEIRHLLYRTAEGMLVSALETLTDPERRVEQPDQIGELYSLPTGTSVLEYIYKNTSGRVRNLRDPETSAPHHDVG